MKVIVLLFVCLVLAVNVKAFTKEEKMAIMKPLVMACQAQEKASDADIAAMMKHEIPSTQEGKCFHSCMQSKLGVIVDGAFAPAGIAELTRKLTNGDDAKIKVSSEMAEACKGLKNADRCELALQVIICMEGEAEKRGIANEY